MKIQSKNQILFIRNNIQCLYKLRYTIHQKIQKKD